MITHGDAFFCIALRTGLPDRSALPVNVGEFGIAAEPPFALDEYFLEVLGSIQYNNFRESNLFLVFRKASNDPTLTAAFDPQLEIGARCLLCALLMFGYAGTRQQSLIAAGKHHPGGIEVCETGTIPPWARRFGRAGNPPGVDLIAAIHAALRFLAVECDALHFARFKRGTQAWLAGCQAEYGADRLHQFVRSLDALLRLKKGAGTKEFAWRSRTFVRLGKQDASDFEEIYRLRSAVEHMNDFGDVLSGYPTSDWDRMSALRVFQVESIAHAAYSRILGNPVLLPNFVDNSSIDAFWKQDDGQRRQSWGPPLDLSAEEVNYFEWH